MRSAPDGVAFPVDGDGKHSTTQFSKDLLAHCVQEASPEVARTVREEKKWRENYVGHFIRHVLVNAADPSHPVAVGRRGLDYVYDTFRFVRDGRRLPIREAMEEFSSRETFRTAVVTGGEGGDGSLPVPYQGKVLSQEKLIERLEQWVADRTIEAGALEALRWVLDHPEASSRSTLDGWVFSLLGAGAAMGPMEALLNLGATVIAVDTAVPALWSRLIAMARASKGTLIIPVGSTGPDLDGMTDEALASVAGCDIVRNAPEIAGWIERVANKDRRIVVGTYGYMDGEGHVRIVVAMDAIATHLMAQRPSTALLQLLTPTDCYAMSADTHAHSVGAYNQWSLEGLWQHGLRLATGGRLMIANHVHGVTTPEGRFMPVAESIVTRQGPNYLVAKRIQQWRAVVARADGHLVSAHVAPASSTASVTSNRILAAAYGGAPHFHPVEIFEPATSRALMTMMLLHDLSNPAARAQPTTHLDSPLDAFLLDAMHGGLWSMPFQLDSIAPVAVAMYYMDIYKPHWAVSVLAALVYARRRAQSRL